MTHSDTLPAALVAGAIDHMNADHADAVLAYAQGLAGLRWAEQARLIALDSGGMTLEAMSGERREQARIAFDAPVIDGEALRRATVELARRARDKLH
jgi:heme iron utilization protein